MIKISEIDGQQKSSNNHLMMVDDDLLNKWYQEIISSRSSEGYLMASTDDLELLEATEYTNRLAREFYDRIKKIVHPVGGKVTMTYDQFMQFIQIAYSQGYINRI